MNLAQVFAIVIAVSVGALGLLTCDDPFTRLAIVAGGLGVVVVVLDLHFCTGRKPSKGSNP